MRSDVVLRYVPGDARNGTERELQDLASADSLSPEHFRPVRRFPSYRGQRSRPGEYWCATTRGPVVYESQVERCVLTMLDYDLDVTWVAAQPFRIEVRGWSRSHVPDFFVRHRDGSATVVAVQASSDPAREAHARAVELGELLSTVTNWRYEVRTPPVGVAWQTVAFLAGFRRPLADRLCVAPRLRQAAFAGATIADLVALAEPPELVRPVLFHLLWQHVLEVPIEAPLRLDTRVSVGSGEWQ